MNHVKEIRYGNTRCYLINEKILVDTDWAGTLPKFLKCLKEENIEPERIKYLFITHFHPDHMGIAQDLAELGVQIVAFQEQKNYIHRSDDIFEKNKRDKKDKNADFKCIDENKVIILSCLGSRKFLEKVGVSGRVIHTPGHSEDSISIILDEGTAIVGDLPPLHVVPAYNDKKIEESWAKILSYHIHTIYYGHEKADYIENIIGGMTDEK